ncbi:MAG: aminotransferase class V-fold PLP-dependent enzyme [Bacteroidetes bacterium]|nr:aminotransferase class V-fold PLP-dependent enzyme [Bacteroidota bacterium]
MTNRRNFMKTAGTIAGTIALGSFTSNSFAKQMEKYSMIPPSETASDEDFWSWIKESYTTSPQLLNLNNGGVAPSPRVVQDAVDRYNKLVNEAPSYYMWRILDAGREPLRAKLADIAGCSPDELAINRNATEALNTVIFGLNLKAGDEVILCKQDYPNMINAWKQREKRDGIKLVWLNFEMPIENDKDFVKAYSEAITEKTKIIHVTHIINWTGQILPVKQIAKIAHEKGIEILCDGAHSFGHFEFKVPDLDCDYFGTSLHKWLSAPIGSGFLYIKKDKIKNVWPLLSNDKPESDDIRKFESLGTRSFPIEHAIGVAVDFYNAIGAKRKEARLFYLKEYWTKKVAHLPNVKFNSPLNNKQSCAICNFRIEGMKPEDVDGKLFEKYKIHTVGINWENVHGVRVTPNVYTSTKDLDRLVKAIEEISASASGK